MHNHEFCWCWCVVIADDVGVVGVADVVDDDGVDNICVVCI